MRPRWKKIFSDLWGNKLRSFLVVASITIGLFAVGMITSMHVHSDRGYACQLLGD